MERIAFLMVWKAEYPFLTQEKMDPWVRYRTRLREDKSMIDSLELVANCLEASGISSSRNDGMIFLH